MIQIRTIFITTETSIPLGYQGENLAREIVFPQTADLLGENWTLFHRRALDKEPYPVPLGMDARGLVWTVTSGDTANMGGGQAQLICTGADGEVLKTLVYRTVVSKSMAVGGEVPDPVKPWYDAILERLDEAQKGADGGYYRLEIQQVEDDTMTVAYVPSKEDMPPVEPVTVRLPAGPQGERGPQGIQGIQGIQGVPGERGEQGLPGEQGPRAYKASGAKQAPEVLPARKATRETLAPLAQTARTAHKAPREIQAQLGLRETPAQREPPAPREIREPPVLRGLKATKATLAPLALPEPQAPPGLRVQPGLLVKHP